ncbi:MULTISPECIES: hypothetical protein [unclassified Roseivivax]|nr:hypothetical protein [Roseivivax sp. GX 12232]MCE0506689.1 hypothetical protein [Roseivivax sp. GX 12232]
MSDSTSRSEAYLEILNKPLAFPFPKKEARIETGLTAEQRSELLGMTGRA